MGCLDKSISSWAEGKGQIELYIVEKSTLNGCPSFTLPTLQVTELQIGHLLVMDTMMNIADTVTSPFHLTETDSLPYP